jgi:hypothetical protein
MVLIELFLKEAAKKVRLSYIQESSVSLSKGFLPPLDA